MAKTNTCDICGEPAITTAKFETTTTTAIESDLCENHTAEIKKILRIFFKQDEGALDVTKEEVIVRQP